MLSESVFLIKLREQVQWLHVDFGEWNENEINLWLSQLSMGFFLNDVWLVLLIQVPVVLIMPNLFVAIAVVRVVCNVWYVHVWIDGV